MTNQLMPPTAALKRRTFLQAGLTFAGLAAGSSALSACGPAGGTASTGRLRAYWWGDNNLNSAVKAAVDVFAQEKDITVSSESGPFDGYWDKLATQTAGGNPPDLQMQAASYLPEYSSKDALLPLDDYVGNQLDDSKMDKGLIDFGTLDGKIYGVVGATNATAVLSNTDQLKSLGIDPPADGMEWDTLAGLATSVHDKSGGKVFGLQDAGGDLIPFNIWIRQQGMDLFDADGKLVPDAEKITEWLTLWDDLRKNGGVVPAQLTSQSAGKIASSPLVSGKAAMTFAWTQDIIPYASSLKAALRVALPPKTGDQEGSWINAASLWSVAAKSEQKDTAVELINFLINDDRAAKELKAILGGPPTKQARQLIKPDLSGGDKMAVEFMDQVAEHSRPLNRLWPPAFAPLRTKFTQVNEAIGFKKSTIAKGVEDFLAEAAKNDAT